MSLKGRTIVLGVTGGIAAYKSAEVVSRLVKAGAQVYVIMTKNACQFVAPLTFESLSNHPVVVDTFARPATWEVEHISLAQRAQVFLIAPATANSLAKMAGGVADDMLSTTLLATRAPVFVAPAMNTGMWENPATVANMAVLTGRGVRVIPPGSGRLACGDVGAGRMAEPVDIVTALEAHFTWGQALLGKKVLVTAGPTREAVDPVRFLGNRSSGKMGYALAEAARDRGAEVTLLSGPVSLAAPAGVKLVPFESTQALYDLMMVHAPAHDVLIQAAAPGDFRVEQVAQQKIKRQGQGELVLMLVPNPDVAAAVGANKGPGQVFVGFAAETQGLEAHAASKLEKKNLDLIVANDVTQQGAGFEVDTNIATLVWRGGSEQLPLMTKRALADRILDWVMDRFKG